MSEPLTTPSPGQWIRIAPYNKNMRMITVYRDHWVLYDGSWQLIKSVDWRLATENEMYLSGTGTKLSHSNFREQVETLDSYRGSLAHYVWLEEYKASTAYFECRLRVRDVVQSIAHQSIDLLSISRSKLRASDLDWYCSTAHDLTNDIRRLSELEHWRVVWLERRQRIDKNVFPEHKTSCFPNVVEFDNFIEKGNT